MACRLFGAKPISESMLPYCQLGRKKHISVKIHLKFKTFYSSNALKNAVCEIATILSQHQCVNCPILTVQIHTRQQLDQTRYSLICVKSKPGDIIEIKYKVASNCGTEQLLRWIIFPLFSIQFICTSNLLKSASLSPILQNSARHTYPRSKRYFVRWKMSINSLRPCFDVAFLCGNIWSTQEAFQESKPPTCPDWGARRFCLAWNSLPPNVVNCSLCHVDLTWKFHGQRPQQKRKYIKKSFI